MRASISAQRLLFVRTSRDRVREIGLTTVCYFLAIGAETQPWRLRSILEEQLQLDLDATEEQSSIVAAFPAEDAVRLLVHRGCSCSLLRPAPKPATVGQRAPGTLVSPTQTCRQTIARAVDALGTVRLYVRTRRNPAPGPLAHLSMTLDEFLRPEANVPANALVNIMARSSVWPPV